VFPVRRVAREGGAVVSAPHAFDRSPAARRQIAIEQIRGVTADLPAFRRYAANPLSPMHAMAVKEVARIEAEVARFREWGGLDG